MKEGDPIWFRQTQRGGYGFQSDVPGRFVRMAGTRAIVLLKKRDGSEKQVAVHPKNVRERVDD